MVFERYDIYDGGSRQVVNAILENAQWHGDRLNHINIDGDVVSLYLNGSGDWIYE